MPFVYDAQPNLVKSSFALLARGTYNRPAMRLLLLVLVLLLPIAACVKGSLFWVAVDPSGGTPIDASRAFDSSFGSGGYVVTSVGDTSVQVVGVLLQDDGRIVVAGHGAGATPGVALVRLLEGGTLDSSFDGDGKVFEDVVNIESAGTSAVQEVSGLTFDPNTQKITLVGTGREVSTVITHCTVCR